MDIETYCKRGMKARELLLDILHQVDLGKFYRPRAPRVLGVSRNEFDQLLDEYINSKEQDKLNPKIQKNSKSAVSC